VDVDRRDGQDHTHDLSVVADLKEFLPLGLDSGALGPAASGSRRSGVETAVPDTLPSGSEYIKPQAWWRACRASTGARYGGDGSAAPDVAAQYYRFPAPDSGSAPGLGHGLRLPRPSVRGSQPDEAGGAIDGDGSFQMNIQELATWSRTGTRSRCFVLNKKQLPGMVTAVGGHMMDGGHHYETCLARNAECEPGLPRTMFQSCRRQSPEPEDGCVVRVSAAAHAAPRTRRVDQWSARPRGRGSGAGGRVDRQGGERAPDGA